MSSVKHNPYGQRGRAAISSKTANSHAAPGRMVAARWAASQRPWTRAASKSGSAVRGSVRREGHPRPCRATRPSARARSSPPTPAPRTRAAGPTTRLLPATPPADRFHARPPAATCHLSPALFLCPLITKPPCFSENFHLFAQPLFECLFQLVGLAPKKVTPQKLSLWKFFLGSNILVDGLAACHSSMPENVSCMSVRHQSALS